MAHCLALISPLSHAAMWTEIREGDCAGDETREGHRLAPAAGVRESHARLVWMTICGGASELGLYARYHVAVFLVREVYLARIHAEEPRIVWSADIFRDEMEVEM